MPIPPAIRTPWPADFPNVIIHTDVHTRDAHPRYAAAKAGDVDSAFALAVDLVSDDAISPILEASRGRLFLFLPVTAEETAGFNAIPDAMAQVLGWLMHSRVVSGEIVQTNKVGHTRARSFQRFVTPAMFDGNVLTGADYVLVDHHVGLGGTLANLRGYIEGRGGRVIAMTTLTESRRSADFATARDPRHAKGPSWRSTRQVLAKPIRLRSRLPHGSRGPKPM